MNMCPGCGKQVEGDFCDACRPKEGLKMKDIKLIVCPICHSFSLRNRWRPYKSLSEAVSITSGMKAEVKDVVLKPGMKVLAEAEVVQDEDHFIVPLRIEATHCGKCKMQKTYFEGVLQLRNADDVILDVVDEFIRINGISVASRDDARKAKKFDKKGLEDVDISFSDKRKLAKLGQDLVDRFGGELKKSPRLFSRDNQTSKDVYRLNVLYEAPLYRKGSVVKVEGKVILISSVGKHIVGTDLKSGRHESVDMKDKDFDPLTTERTTVSKVRPVIEVFDPETYQSIPVHNIGAVDVKIGEKVKVVSDGGTYYIIG